MKQKVVIKVRLNGQKSRSKALKIVVGFSGVESAGIGGQDKSQIEVVGDGIDVAKLTILLKKKMGYADIVSVAAVGGEKKEEKKEEPKVQQEIVWPMYGSGTPHTYIHYPSNHYQDPPCSIM
ncbi:unnamed protein product [Dovyalis caffra]|uniref:Heavy metal-associated isoprenylated plant protein 16-like n=1 Tax=Dovyalis caffra TaxID=77055 RepID=A0AAV1SCI9_9ROSI|nr:unnamed protein product [Dovyalis caffra]